MKEGTRLFQGLQPPTALIRGYNQAHSYSSYLLYLTHSLRLPSQLRLSLDLDFQLRLSLDLDFHLDFQLRLSLDLDFHLRLRLPLSESKRLVKDSAQDAELWPADFLEYENNWHLPPEASLPLSPA